jgi:uncharacterized protein YjgD (DUF1641 family)
MSDIASVLKTEFNEDFIEKMKNRMVASFYKYGPVAKNAENTDEIKSLKDRLKLYEETGNTEWLVDVANFAMIEFTYPQHPKAHFRATDSDESPGVHGLTWAEIQKFNEENKIVK